MGCAKEALEHFGLFLEGFFLKIECSVYGPLFSLVNIFAPMTKHFAFLRVFLCSLVPYILSCLVEQASHG